MLAGRFIVDCHHWMDDALLRIFGGVVGLSVALMTDDSP